jgi:hypothetical protein
VAVNPFIDDIVSTIQPLVEKNANAVIKVPQRSAQSAPT